MKKPPSKVSVEHVKCSKTWSQCCAWSRWNWLSVLVVKLLEPLNRICLLTNILERYVSTFEGRAGFHNIAALVLATCSACWGSRLENRRVQTGMWLHAVWHKFSYVLHDNQCHIQEDSNIQTTIRSVTLELSLFLSRTGNLMVKLYVQFLFESTGTPIHPSAIHKRKT